MKEPTDKQVAMLKALNPFRVDANKTFADAAQELGITEQGVKMLMMRLKERCPEIYIYVRKLRIQFNRDGRKLKNPILLDPKVIEQLEQYGKIKDIF
jgi:DNA-binding Lrp family transcriptional regulator